MVVSLITIGIVFGGVSGEHDVSIKSAANIVNALRNKSNSKKYKVISFYIDRQGLWWSGSVPEEILKEVKAPLKSKLDNSINYKNSNFFPEKTKDELPELLKGPSTKSFEPKVLADNFPPISFLFPSIVFISIIEETLPPYSALKPPVYTSVFLIISVSKTENKPIE